MPDKQTIKIKAKKIELKDFPKKPESRFSTTNFKKQRIQSKFSNLQERPVTNKRKTITDKLENLSGGKVVQARRAETSPPEEKTKKEFPKLPVTPPKKIKTDKQPKKNKLFSKSCLVSGGGCCSCSPFILIFFKIIIIIVISAAYLAEKVEKGFIKMGVKAITGKFGPLADTLVDKLF